MSGGASLRTSLRDGALELTLDRPEKRNALGRDLIEALHRELERADLDPAVRVVVVRGEGRDFCAGADLEELLASADRSLAENEADALRLGGVFSGFRALPKPVVALVHGRALAGGAGLALAADIVLAAETATLGFPEIDRGFVPAMVMTLLRRSVGEKVAFELVATGRLVTAAEARNLGLVSRVLPEAELDSRAETLVRALGAAEPSALALTKRLFYELDGIGFAGGLALAARVNAAARATPGFRRAIAEFLHR